MKDRITVHSEEKITIEEFQLYVLDKAERDMLTIAEHLYFNDPKSKGKEESYNLIGLAHQNSKSEIRIITRVGHGKTVGSAASVTNLADTIDAMDSKAKAEGSNIVGAGHLHPFPNGHLFLSQTDKETMKTYGAMDPGYVFVVLNPLTSQYTVYRWDTKRNEAVKIQPTIIKTMPMFLRNDHRPIIVNQWKSDSNSKLIERIRSIVRNATLIFIATTSTALITLFSINPFSEPLMLLYPLACTLGYFGLTLIHTIRSIGNEAKSFKGFKETQP